MGTARRPTDAGHNRHAVVVRLTYRQAQAIHEILSVVANDPDWAGMVGEETISFAADGHNAIIEAYVLHEGSDDGT